ncbi:MAG: hypothetical protein QOD62_1119, partial [Actinomycetota bacterium]|nr:hypothetical protein [Actinomycetota bacterium]
GPSMVRRLRKWLGIDGVGVGFARHDLQRDPCGLASHPRNAWFAEDRRPATAGPHLYAATGCGDP